MNQEKIVLTKKVSKFKAFTNAGYIECFQKKYSEKTLLTQALAFTQRIFTATLLWVTLGTPQITGSVAAYNASETCIFTEHFAFFTLK